MNIFGQVPENIHSGSLTLHYQGRRTCHIPHANLVISHVFQSRLRNGQLVREVFVHSLNTLVGQGEGDVVSKPGHLLPGFGQFTRECDRVSFSCFLRLQPPSEIGRQLCNLGLELCTLNHEGCHRESECFLFWLQKRPSANENIKINSSGLSLVTPIHSHARTRACFLEKQWLDLPSSENLPRSEQLSHEHQTALQG